MVVGGWGVGVGVGVGRGSLRYIGGTYVQYVLEGARQLPSGQFPLEKIAIGTIAIGGTHVFYPNTSFAPTQLLPPHIFCPHLPLIWYPGTTCIHTGSKSIRHLLYGDIWYPGTFGLQVQKVSAGY